MKKPMHSLLRRQLKRFFGGTEQVPQAIHNFIEAVDDAYREFDVDREMIERSLDLSSQEMLQTNAEMRAIFLALPDIIFRLDATGTILDCQAGSMDDFYMFPKDKIIGKKIRDVNFLNVGDKFQEAISTVQADKTIITTEYMLKVRGALNYYEARLVPFLDNQVIVIIRNMTDRKNADEALRTQEERFRALIEKATDLITIIAIDGAILYQSPSSEWVLGYAPEDLIGKSALDYVHPDDLPAVAAALKPSSSVMETETLELRLQHKNGDWRYLETVARDMSSHPEIDGVILNSRDITEKKLAQEAQRISDMLYRTIFENTGTAIMIIEENGKISLANKKAEWLTGYCVEELSALPHWSKLATPKSLETIIDYMLALKAQSLSWPRSYEGQLVRKDGKKTDVFLTVNNIPTTNRLIASILDLTDIKAAQKALQESEEKYRLLIENSTDGIFIIQDNVIKFPNRNTILTLGYSEDELAAMPFTSILHPEDLDEAMTAFARQLSAKAAPSPITFRVLTKAGEELWAEVLAVETVWQGTRAIINFVRNVTQQKKLETQLLHAQKMEAVGTLAGGIAHDFNNLLMGIQGYASIMLMDEDRPEADVDMLRAIEQQVKSGADLTKQLLGFARAGKYELKPISLNDVLQKTSTIFGRTKKEITIHTKLADNLWIVEADRGQIEQCLLNLYVNAWQAMPAGGELYLATQNWAVDDDSAPHLDLTPGNYVNVSVSDTGTGMDKKTRSRIFEPFFTTKEMGRGTGLGLASVYGIMKNHKGVINVQSEMGHGTTFNIFLPASEKVLAEDIAPSPGFVQGTETILLVDDEKIVSDVTEVFLTKLGYNVMTAQSGKAAIDLYKNNQSHISLVILDMIMPEMNGEETFAALKALDSKIKIILSSGYSINQKVLELLDRGCLEFVQKPYDVNNLSRIIRKVLDNV
jgi:PAS domain S-box-containing protein